jgi:spore coat protein CotH
MLLIEKYFLFLFCLFCFGCGNFTGFDNPDVPDTGNLKKIKLYFSNTEFGKLYNSSFEDHYACCLYKDGVNTYDVFLKIRGDISRAYPKKSFTLKFENIKIKERYALGVSFKDPSAIRNIIAMDIYDYVGIPGIPERECIALFINDTYMGYYTKIKLYEEKDMQKYYGKSELFKCKFNSFGNDMPIHYLSEKQFPDDDDFSTLDRLVAYTKNMNDDEWQNFIQKHFDIENSARYLFVHNLLAVTDTAEKNFNIIYSKQTGKYSILPWDNEACLGRSYSGNVNDISAYEFDGDNMLMRRLLGKGLIRERYKQLVNGTAGEKTIDDITKKIKELADIYYDKIDKAMKYDSRRFYTYETFKSEKDYIKSFVDSMKSALSIP